MNGHHGSFVVWSDGSELGAPGTRSGQASATIATIPGACAMT
jgi:hypothetical protein